MSLFHFFTWAIQEKRDPRVDGWYLMDSPWPTLAIVTGYVLLTTWLGPILMTDRKPMDLRRVLVLYNSAMVVWSAYLLMEFLESGWAGHYSFRCQPVDYSDDPMALRMVRACYLTYLTKIAELMDTVFFVVRKKYEQVTLLHVYHHGLMPINGWLGTRFAAGGHGTLCIAVNLFVHVVMYSYYALSAMGPRYHRYVWWKRYLTSLQISQFVVIAIHSFQLLIFDCGYPRLTAYWIGFNAFVFLFMFAHFYRVAYDGNRRKTNTTM